MRFRVTRRGKCRRLVTVAVTLDDGRADIGPINPDLAIVIDASPMLPEAPRRAVLGIVRAAGRK